MASPITLPSRGPSGFTRRRAAQLPTAADVPIVAPVSDPGVNIPDFGRFAGAGTAAIGEVIGDIGDAEAKALARQKKEHDAVQVGKAELEVDRFGVEERERLSAEGTDLSNTQVLTDNEEFWKSLIAQKRIDLQDADVSQSAIDRSILRMQQAALADRESLGAESLKALRENAEELAIEQTNTATAQAAKGPELTDQIVNFYLEKQEEGRGSTNAQVFDARIKEGQAAIIRGGIEGFIKRGDPGDTTQAKSLLSENAELFDRAEQATIRKAITKGHEEAVMNGVLKFVDDQDSFTEAFALLELNRLDPRTQALWKGLNADEKLEVKSRALKLAGEIRTLENAERANVERGLVDRDREDLAEFYKTQDLELRRRLTDRVLLRGNDPTLARRMEETLSNSETFSDSPTPPLEADLGRDLDRGLIGADDIAKQRDRLSRDSYTRLIARAGTVSNRALQDSYRMIDRSLKIPPSQVILDDEMIRLAGKAELIKAELQRWHESNPEASSSEIREQRDIILKSATVSVNSEMATEAQARIESVGGTIPGFNTSEPEQSILNAIKNNDLSADDNRIRSIRNAVKELNKYGATK